MGVNQEILPYAWNKCWIKHLGQEWEACSTLAARLQRQIQKMERVKLTVTMLKTWEEALQKSSRETRAAFVAAAPAPSPSSQQLRQMYERATTTNIELRQWYSYCFQTDTSVDEFREILHFLKGSKKYSYLLYSHFRDDRPTDDDSCRGDHYHLLINANFTTRSGNMVKASQTYVYQWLNKMMTKKERPKASCKAVKYFTNYVII